MKRNLFQVGSVFGAGGAALTSTAASICCIGPLAISLLGVEGAILAAGIKPYRTYLLAGSLLLLGVAFWGVYGQKKVCTNGECPPGAGKVTKSVLWSGSVLWVGALVIQVLADRYWL